ncbi:MAG: tetratricopeptide repeat protein [Gloeomargaritaceae cyanobacterium C42_A2020_066]|nr:tetratricopeptide repeat protein [Gloeomargaritaceae cyanobacterium C42_A2020_066]
MGTEPTAAGRRHRQRVARARTTGLIAGLLLMTLVGGCSRPAALYQEGKAQLDRGEVSRAVKSLTLALRESPRNDLKLLFEIYSQRGLAYMRLNQYEEALADLDAALALKPDDPETLHNRGLTNLALGRAMAAREDFEKVDELGGRPK